MLYFMAIAMSPIRAEEALLSRESKPVLPLDAEAAEVYSNIEARIRETVREKEALDRELRLERRERLSQARSLGAADANVAQELRIERAGDHARVIELNMEISRHKEELRAILLKQHGLENPPAVRVDTSSGEAKVQIDRQYLMEREAYIRALDLVEEQINSIVRDEAQKNHP